MPMYSKKCLLPAPLHFTMSGLRMSAAAASAATAAAAPPLSIRPMRRSLARPSRRRRQSRSQRKILERSRLIQVVSVTGDGRVE